MPVFQDLSSGAVVDNNRGSSKVERFSRASSSTKKNERRAASAVLQKAGMSAVAPERGGDRSLSIPGVSPGILGAAMSLIKKNGDDAISRTSVKNDANLTDIQGQKHPPGDGELHDDEESIARGDDSSPYHHALFTAPESSEASATAPLVLTIDTTSTGQALPISETHRRSSRAKRGTSASKRQPLLPSDAKAINSGSRPSKAGPTATSAKRSERTKKASYKNAASSATRKAKGVKIGGKAGHSSEDRKKSSITASPSSGSSESTEYDASQSMTGITQRQSGNFQARVYFERKGYYLGMFPTAEQASVAITVAKSELEKQKLTQRLPGRMFKRARAAALKAAAKLSGAHEPVKKQNGPGGDASPPPHEDPEAFSLHSKIETQRTQEAVSSAGKRKKQVGGGLESDDKTNQPPPAKRTAVATEQDDSSAELLLLLATVADGNSATTSTDAVDNVGTNKDEIPQQKAPLENAKSNIVTAASSAKESLRAASKKTVPGHAPQKTVYLDPPALPTPQSNHHIEYAVISSKHHVYVATDRDMPIMVKVNVLELCGAREVTHVIGTFPDVRQAICIFETVCCLMRDGGASFRPQDLAFALEMNDKRMPHMPPSLIRGHLGIAFLPQKLEWHLYCYFGGSKTPVVIGKYRIFVDAIFAYKTTSKLLHDTFYYYNIDMLKLRVRMDCLAHRAKTSPNFNHHTEIEMRHSLNNIRCMFAHALQEGTRPLH